MPEPTTMNDSLRDNETVMDMSDLMSALEGATADSFKGSIGPGPGRYAVTIKDVSPLEVLITPKDTAKAPFTITVARVLFTMDEAPFTGWERKLDLNIGKNTLTGQLNDAGFRSSVKQVLGPAVVEKQILDIAGTNVGEQYKLSFDLLKGKKAKVTFRRDEGKENDEDATAWPRGILTAVDAPAAAGASKSKRGIL